MADSQHIAGELMKRFSIKRPLEYSLVESLNNYGEDGKYLSVMLEGALPAIALDAAPLSSAVINDSGCGDTAFAQMICGLGNPGDVFWGISTSGNARNIILAAITAKAKGLQVLGMTGDSGGKLIKLSDACICVPEDETYKIQELHLPVYHSICLMLENEFFGK
jgi:D-sedoheptulose 7-phosphate isomerase